MRKGPARAARRRALRSPCGPGASTAPVSGATRCTRWVLPVLAAAGRSHSGVGSHVAACAAQRRMRPCTSARWPAGSAASQGSAPAAAAHGLAGARRRRRVERGRGAPAPVAQERALLERLVQRRTRADHHPAFQVIARPCLEARQGLAWAGLGFPQQRRSAHRAGLGAGPPATGPS